MKSKYIMLAIILLGAYPTYIFLERVYVDHVLNSNPKPMSMYRLVTSSKGDWSPARRIFVQGYFGYSSGSDATLWVSESDAKLSTMGAGIDIVDDRIVKDGCYGHHVMFVGMIGIPKGERRVVLYDAEQIYLVKNDSNVINNTYDRIEKSEENNCYLMH